MRIYIKITPNRKTVDYNYQSKLVGTLHKWLGNNNLHDGTSLYSFSWLKNGKAHEKGLEFKKGARWFISAHDTNIIKKIIQGIQNNPEIAYGMFAQEIIIQKTPVFTRSNQLFHVASPVFIKRNDERKNKKYYYHNHEKANDYLTETLQYKLKIAGIRDLSAKVAFDQNYPNPTIKKIDYKGLSSLKASFCPVIVSGKPETIAFAWNVGVGSSTGIGFGALV